MAFSSMFRRVNVKELISNASVYASATGDSICAVGLPCTFLLFWKIFCLPEICLIPESSGGMSLVFRRWATKKTAGSTKNGRDSNPKYLGVKKFGGEVHPLYNFYSMTLMGFKNNFVNCINCYHLEPLGAILILVFWITFIHRNWSDAISLLIDGVHLC